MSIISLLFTGRTSSKKNVYDLETIIFCTNLPIDPRSCAQLQKVQPTFAAVEKSFSMLSKLLRKDRNFDVKNVKIIYDAVLQ